MGTLKDNIAEMIHDLCKPLILAKSFITLFLMQLRVDLTLFCCPIIKCFWINLWKVD